MLATLICTLWLHSFQDVLDQVTWNTGSSLTFTIRSQYQLLQPTQPQDKATTNLWKVVSPLKVTTWLAVWERLPIVLYLYIRHIRPLSLCAFCGNHTESSTHICLSCDFAGRVWAPFVTSLALSHPSLYLSGSYGRIDGLHVSLERGRRFGTFMFKQWFGPSRLNATRRSLARKRSPRMKFLSGLYSTLISGEK